MQYNAKIKSNWMYAGKELIVLGDPIIVNDVSWTPVLFSGEEDHDFFKTAGIEFVSWKF